ncbi:MAG TPA: transcriptional regulator [Gammaproteobacteria bacterium]|nr:transcriptional regulator [Acidiferrobacteraceae bacterium]MDP6551692.1 WYL domain-containing protein [Arenicellales bacterium]MDP6792158.1 WYL domain-containing protein [Arenicellales bacterium]MDP6919698.1 WYL domain-containing protein [Arenicellales bacterium]HCX88038.1 transcriptional regulator [Gammaproteobacteria bacterium]
MDRTERFYTIDRLLRSRQGTTLRAMMDEMEVSRATVRRDLEYMRDRLAAPIIWDNEARRYRYDSDAEGEGEDRYALPGLWFNASEVHALLTMEHLLSSLQPGLLEPHIEPLRSRIRRLLDSGDHPAEEVTRRIRVLHMAARQADSEVFGVISHALLRRQRLKLEHLNRRTGEVTRRTVSPQRLAHYRDNWYLDSWCHLRKGLRSFAVDAIEAAEIVEHQKARDVTEAELEKVLGTGYGIFAGEHVKQAVLRFSAEAARWVAREKWHSRQHGELNEDGSYTLTIPYADETELVMDIMRHGADAEVLAPDSLRQAVQRRLGEAASQYSG